MAGYAGVPNNLPDIDADDLFAPEAYRDWIVQHNAGEVPPAPAMDARVPSYHEQAPVTHYNNGYSNDYGAYNNPQNDFDYYAEHEKMEQEDISNTPVRHRDFARPVARYATPELEGQAMRGEDRSFDGPEDYASTADHEHRHVAPLRVRATGRSPTTTTTTPRRRFGLYRSTNSKQNGDSSKSLARSMDDEKAGRDEDDVPLNPHFGPVPTVQLRRNRTKRRIGLTAGNLVIDAPIPSRLAGFLPRKGTEEFDKMRLVNSDACHKAILTPSV